MFGLKKMDHVRSGFFGIGFGDIGEFQQCVDVTGVFRVQTASHADGNADVVVSQPDGLRKGVEQVCGNLPDVVGLADVFGDDDEFIVSHPDDCIRFSQGGFEPAGDQSQQFVAQFVTETFVDELEAVDIQQQDSQFFSGSRSQLLLGFRSRVCAEIAVGREVSGRTVRCVD